MLVRDIMTTEVESCTPQTTLYDAACLMADSDCGSLPVVDDQINQKLVGMITDRDIVCRAIVQDLDPRIAQVSDCMSRDIETVTPDTDIRDCCQRLEARRIRRIPVVDGMDRCCGMVTRADLARHLDAHELATTIREISEPSSAVGAARVR